MIKEEFVLKSKHGDRPFLSDLRYLETGSKKPLVLFIHGFKGFKDFAYFNLMADELAKAGMIVVKMNLSHNGTTPEDPLNFVDLEAFGKNNFSIELDDIGVMLDHIISTEFPVASSEFDTDKIYIMGHSRSGGISIIKAHEDSRIKKIVTWASVPGFTSFIRPDAIEEWKASGVHFILNGRTNQNMPLYYQLAEDYLASEERFDVMSCESLLTIPHLIVHGDNDETVPVAAAHALHDQAKNAELVIIEGASHTFGGAHPNTGNALPFHAAEALDKTIEFFKA